jgi:hypothetical protein
MAYTILDLTSNTVTAIFGNEQNPPLPDNFAILDDADPRVIAYNNNVVAIISQAGKPKTTISFLQFMNLFTPTEQGALVNSNDTQVKLFNLMAAGAGAIDLSNNEVIGGVDYVASLGIIANNRVAEILAGTLPTGNT